LPPPSPPGIGAAGFGSGLSAITASVVKKNQGGLDAAFCNADRVTFAGSIIPALIMSTYSPVAAFKTLSSLEG
jgi:hypothetical protein